MDLRDRLRLLQELTGLTQTALARELDVSFVTLNRWMNGKAVPRKNALDRITQLLLHHLGGGAVLEDPLEARKWAILHRAEQGAAPLSRIFGRRDILDEFVLRLTYTSNRIEGSTLTEAETAAVLFENVAVPRKALADQIAARNHQAALLAMLQHLQRRDKLDEALVLRLHGILMNGLVDDAGRYRTHGVRIVGSDIPTVNHLSVPMKMEHLMDDVSEDTGDVIGHAADAHARFEQIHPFSDGNGRIGRLLLHAMLLKRNLPPAIIRPERKLLYYKALAEAQRGHGAKQLEQIVCDGVLEGYRVMEG